MAVRSDEVASSIDAQVRESIEKMVAEIRSSVEDVRVVVDQQLKAALQSVQADVNSISFLPQIQKAIGDLEETLAAGRPPAATAGSARVKAAMQAIERGRSQVDVLNALLDQCVAFGSRAALLILRGDTFSGWKGIGFTAHGGHDEAIKRFNAAPGAVPELDRLLRNEQVITWDGANMSTRFGVGASDNAVLIPMVIKDKVAAAVYVDAVGDDLDKFDIQALELLVFTTGLLVDTLAIRKKIPSPSLAEEELAGAPAATAPPRPVAPPAPAPAPAPAAPAAPAPAPADSIPLRTVSGNIPVDTGQMRQVATPRAGFNVPSADDFSGATPAPAPRRPPSVEMPRPAAPTTGTATEDRPSTQYIPPPGIARGSGFAPQTDEAKKHDEARRFARLLVSEIKLYNEAKVEQGRKNHDLYDRLKEDIDRSRQMYDERIADEVRKSSNYFYDELVRILADGKADSLGL